MNSLLNISTQDGVALVMLDNPHAPVNVIAPEWLEEMGATFDKLVQDDGVIGIVIASAKPGFMAGADLKYMLTQSARMTPVDAFDFSQSITKLFRKIETCGKPTVAAIGGFALGGGYELALACTRRIAADDPRVVVGLPEVNVGLLPGAGGTQRLSRMIGVKTAMDLLLSGLPLKAADALTKGLVDEVVPREQLMERAREWLLTKPDPTRPWDVKGFRLPEADGLLSYPFASYFATTTAGLHARYGDNFPAPHAISCCVFEGVQLPIDKALAVESRYFGKLLAGSVSRNIIRTMFVGKGFVDKGGHRPTGQKRAPVKTMAVLGIGDRALAMAEAAADAGCDVRLVGVARDGGEVERNALDALIEQRASGSDRSGSIKAIAMTALREVDLVVDVLEASNRTGVLRQILDMMTPSAIIIVDAGAHQPDLDADLMRHKNIVPAMFHPGTSGAALMEIVQGPDADAMAINRAFDVAALLRLTPVIVNGISGLFTQRMARCYAQEGIALLEEGVAPSLIENIAHRAGMTDGPLWSADMLSRSAGSQDTFYESIGGGESRLSLNLPHRFSVSAEQPDSGAIETRLLYRQALEGARCLEEDIISNVTEADLASVLGCGFPSWAGGALSFIDMIGVGKFVQGCEELTSRHGSRFAPTDGLMRMVTEQRTFHRG